MCAGSHFALGANMCAYSDMSEPEKGGRGKTDDARKSTGPAYIVIAG